jgi:hypothetical protein
MGRMVLLLLGIFCAAKAIVAVCTGHMKLRRFGSYELTPATDPLGFWGRVAVCAVLATVAFLVVFRKR